MREIRLSRGKVALVDDEDYEKINQFRWYAGSNNNSNAFYAVRTFKGGNEKREAIFMHRAIINPPKDLEVDHINGNGLDNQRSNLRIVSHRENSQNGHSKTTSKYPGVYWSGGIKRWVAQIRVGDRRRVLGRYIEEEAAYFRYMMEVKLVTDKYPLPQRTTPVPTLWEAILPLVYEMPEPGPTKTCITCGETKELIGFSKKYCPGGDGYRNQCRSCINKKGNPKRRERRRLKKVMERRNL